MTFELPSSPPLSMATEAADQIAGLVHANYPIRDLELATHLSRWHETAQHHLSASECETLSIAELLSLGGSADEARWGALNLGYTDPLGAPWLREAIASTYDKVKARDLVCFAGAQEALYATLHSVLTPGDHAIVVLPSYQSMETLPLGLCAVSGVALNASAGWSLDIDEIAASVRTNTRVIAISFPNNPTGKHLERDRFDALVSLCRKHGIWLLSDEVYRLTERDPADRLPQAADVYERGISFGSMSKAYGLPGLRIGWVAARDTAITARLATIRQYLSTCSAGPSEVLACIALHASAAVLARNRAITESNLTQLLGFFSRHQELFDCRPPDGGMVCYPTYKGPGGVERFVTRMAETAGVLLLPASVFRSDVIELPRNRFRIGFGRQKFMSGLGALEQAIG